MFENRRDAGRQLAERLLGYANREDIAVLALPRGGVPVAYEVARRLNAPLDVFVVRKLGLPGHPELAMGAIAHGVRVMNEEVVRYYAVSAAAIGRVAEAEGRELERRENAYRDGLPPLDLTGKTAILVDDGLATGASMRAAVRAVKPLGAGRTVVAVPVASREICEALRREVDEVVCLLTPDHFYAVGQVYRDFGQTDDGEVRDLLARAARERGAGEGEVPDTYPTGE